MYRHQGQRPIGRHMPNATSLFRFSLLPAVLQHARALRHEVQTAAIRAIPDQKVRTVLQLRAVIHPVVLVAQRARVLGRAGGALRAVPRAMPDAAADVALPVGELDAALPVGRLPSGAVDGPVVRAPASPAWSRRLRRRPLGAVVDVVEAVAGQTGRRLLRLRAVADVMTTLASEAPRLFLFLGRRSGGGARCGR